MKFVVLFEDNPSIAGDVRRRHNPGVLRFWSETQ
jgi:hypothetical protein